MQSLSLPVNVGGVSYYSTPQECISEYNKKSLFDKTKSYMGSWGYLVGHTIYAINRMVKPVEREVEPYTKAPSSESLNNKLVICLPGLNQDPTQFKEIVDSMHKQGLEGSDIFIPKIPLKGNDKMETMVRFIKESVFPWMESGNRKEIVFIGVSYGARIARSLEADLINSGKLPKTLEKIRFISIVGACKGSSLTTWLKNAHLASFVFSKQVESEMSRDSKSTQQLDEKCAKAFDYLTKNTKVERLSTYVAGSEDQIVPDQDSSLMEDKVGKAKYGIISFHGHNSAIRAVADSVAKIVVFGY